MTTYLIYAVLALQVLDVASTLYAFKNGAVEANPIMRTSIEALGTLPGLLIPKIAFAAGIWYFRPLFADWALMVVCIGYLAVVINNVRIARQ